MHIFPIRAEDGTVMGYRTSPVFTSIPYTPPRGVAPSATHPSRINVWVSNGYVAATRAEVIRLALNNADIRRRISMFAVGVRF
jgi:hypothetical protein